MVSRKTKNLNKMIKDRFFAGLRIVLPIVLFIIIINWGVGLLFDMVEFIEQLFPESTVGSLNLPGLVVKLLVLVALFVIICVIGEIYQRPEMRDKIKGWLTPLVNRIPLLSHLFVVTNEVYDTFKRTDSFKRAVLVPSPFFTRGWTVGFITNEEPDVIEEALDIEDMVAVVVPFSPPTSSILVFYERKDIKESKIAVSEAVSMIMWMGTAGATKKIKESLSVSEGDFFKFGMYCFLVLEGYNVSLMGIVLLMIEFVMKRKSLTEKNMKIKNHFLTGLLAVLPTVLFFVILGWLLSLILRWVGKIVELFPDAMMDKLLLPEIVVHFLGFLVLCGLIWLLGFIMNQGRIGERVKSFLDPLIEKVPLLSSLTKITNQAANTLKNTNSFKKVILTRFPMEKTRSVGFLTGEDLEVFEKASGEMHLVSVFIPTTPNPTNGYLVLMNPRDFIETDVPVSLAISFVISMGTAGATNEILKKTKKSDF